MYDRSITYLATLRLPRGPCVYFDLEKRAHRVSYACGDRNGRYKRNVELLVTDNGRKRPMAIIVSLVAAITNGIPLIMWLYVLLAVQYLPIVAFTWVRQWRGVSPRGALGV
jgi:hypothetical protein